VSEGQKSITFYIESKFTNAPTQEAAKAALDDFASGNGKTSYSYAIKIEGPTGGKLTVILRVFPWSS